MSHTADLRPPPGVTDAVLAAATDPILILDREGRVVRQNDAAQVLFGEAFGSAEAPAIKALFAHESRHRLAQAVDRATETGEVECFEAKAAATAGWAMDVSARLAPVVEADGELAGYCLVLRDISARHRNDVALSRLVECSQLVGHAFCEAMVGAIAEALSVRTVILAELDPMNPGRARTIAVWSDGALAPDFEYDLRGTPCRDVLESAVCVHPDNVAALYPEDSMLADMHARAYVGSPLRASNGRVVGLLAAIHDAPLDPATNPDSILEIFSGRAAAELEREATVTHNEYLGRLIEGSISEVYVFDAQTLLFRFVNKGARENLGYSMDEMSALTPLDLKPDFTPEAFEAQLEPLRSGEVPSLAFRTRHLRKDGTLYPVEVRLQLITGFGVPVYFAAIEDVTQRARAEQALQKTEARLRRLFAQSPAGIVETDVEGRMTLVNRTWCDMLGYDEQELLGMSVFEVTHEDSVKPTREGIAKLIAGADGLVIEKNYRRKDGLSLPASSNVSALRDENGQFLGVAAVVLDMSQRAEAERAVRESEALLRRILDGTLAFIGVLRPDGTLIEANAPALMAGGLTREDVVGRKFWDCHWWSYDDAVMDRLKAAVERAARGSIERYDEVVRMQGDSRITIDFMLTPVHGEDGTVQFLVPSGFDISERKRQEARIVNLMREVNHRSKNLLTVVQSIARQMPKSSPEDFTQEFGRRLQALAACQDLLIRSGWEDVPLDRLIRSQLMHFDDLLGTRITLNGPHVDLSPSAAQTLGMAIYELTTNAAKYGALSNDCGRIHIEWRLDAGEPGAARFTLGWREAGGPAVTQPDATGFGSVVLDHLVAMSLDGDCATEFAASGLIWKLSCPPQRLGVR